jgi:hypothetical protein
MTTDADVGLRQYLDARGRVFVAIGELQEAQGGTWLEAVLVAIDLVESRTRAEWFKREQALWRRWLWWVPRREWRQWLRLHWPRKWLPRL